MTSRINLHETYLDPKTAYPSCSDPMTKIYLPPMHAPPYLEVDIWWSKTNLTANLMVVLELLSLELCYFLPMKELWKYSKVAAFDLIASLTAWISTMLMRKLYPSWTPELEEILSVRTCDISPEILTFSNFQRALAHLSFKGFMCPPDTLCTPCTGSMCTWKSLQGF